MAESLRVEGLRELDAAVGEHVMHLEVAMTPLPSSRQKGDIWRDLPRYSEGVGTAWEIDDQARAEGRIARTVVVVTETGENFVTLYPADGSGRFYVSGGQRTLPLALCVAHLRAVGVEVELALPEAEDGSRLRAGKERRD